MTSILLRLISIDVLIEFLIGYLASTVKNPTSAAALRLRSLVRRLYNASRTFLERTGGIE